MATNRKPRRLRRYALNIVQLDSQREKDFCISLLHGQRSACVCVPGSVDAARIPDLIAVVFEAAYRCAEKRLGPTAAAG